ncbi:ornithine cyclodeaminase [Diaphorobacter caeni]|uniref:ornithine cyclodeaminase n=1 Tax=Diaphorobacter caeni TaxID=2784387 RepID=UPI00188E517A|nr:ornithine cyclodeaminase [Diaphorobacter caeni]MBF5004555.1 ornithine cyclodeaminase [Diaphorobacter caeni]
MSAVHTEFLSASNAARLVARTGVVECLRLMADAIEADFSRWQDFDKSARVAAHSAHGVIELMPVADATDYAFKYVNGHPGNTRHGLPTVMAFGALADVATGAPRFVSELTLTTALRTAATSLMVARRLARPGSRSMALIGNGSQSEFQALAFVSLLGVRELRLFDVDAAASAKLLRNITPTLREHGATARICDSTEDAVRGADIVTTLTADKARATIVRADMLAPGMHLNAVGGDCPGKTELAAAVLARASVFVEYEPQTRVEGDLQQMPADFVVTEFWRVVQGLAPGRSSDDDITVFDSVGFALEDYSALRTLRELGRRAGLLESIELIPDLPDPKDLFGLLDLSARPEPSRHLRRA